jgi:thiamine pyrophosphokinase
VLAGAKLPELKRASALAGSVADRCILVAVDGGLKTCVAGRRRPDLFVGDGDSSRKPPTELASVVFSRDKDFSDLAGALAEMRQRKVQLVAVAGLLGGRLDHEWANLLELGSWSRWFAGFLAPTDRGTVLITSRGCRMVTVPKRTFSLFALGSFATVTLAGTRWELQRRRLRPGSHGLSNLTGTDLDLTVHAGSVALVFPPPRRRRRRTRTAS